MLERAGPDPHRSGRQVPGGTPDRDRPCPGRMAATRSAGPVTRKSTRPWGGPSAILTPVRSHTRCTLGPSGARKTIEPVLSPDHCDRFEANASTACLIPPPTTLSADSWAWVCLATRCPLLASFISLSLARCAPPGRRGSPNAEASPFTVVAKARAGYGDEEVIVVAVTGEETPATSPRGRGVDCSQGNR